MKTYFSILAWIIPWTEEPGRLQGSQRESDWVTEYTAGENDHKGKPASISFCNRSLHRADKHKQGPVWMEPGIVKYCRPKVTSLGFPWEGTGRGPVKTKVASSNTVWIQTWAWHLISSTPARPKEWSQVNAFKGSGSEQDWRLSC